jgi:hypothetical protein
MNRQPTSVTVAVAQQGSTRWSDSSGSGSTSAVTSASAVPAPEPAPAVTRADRLAVQTRIKGLMQRIGSRRAGAQKTDAEAEREAADYEQRLFDAVRGASAYLAHVGMAENDLKSSLQNLPE